MKPFYEEVPMVQVTEAAAALLGGAIRDRQLPPSGGVRVSGTTRDDGRLELGLDLADGPADTDQVSEHAGTRLFVASEVAEQLAHATIDIQHTDGRTRLTISRHGDH